MSRTPEVTRLLSESTNYTYEVLPTHLSSCPRIHITRITEEEYMLYLHLITFASTLFTLLAAYCILFKSSQSMGNFKWCLLNLQIWTYCTDFMIGSAAAPRVFFPIVGGRPLGFFAYFGMNIPLLIYVGFGCFGAMVASVTLLFLYRHQVTVNANSVFRFPRFFRAAIVVVNYVLYVNVILPALLIAPEDQLEAKMETLRVRYPILLAPGRFRSFLHFCIVTFAYQVEPCPAKDILHENSFIFLKSSYRFLFSYFCFVIAFVGIECLVMALHCSWVLFFSTLTRKLSRKTRRMQVKYLFALFAQIVIPNILCNAPLLNLAIYTIRDCYSQFANDICVLILSTHGLVSALCLLLFYDCYRKHILYWICLRKFNKSSRFITGNPSGNSVMMTNVQINVMT